MIRKWLAALGLAASGAASGAAPTMPPYSPYPSDAANTIYNLLFCDDLAAYAKLGGVRARTDWQAALASSPADVTALEAIANDVSQEGRIRYLAFRRLAAAGRTVPAKILLGVIIEVPTGGGVDTLAVYTGGGVRYINHGRKMTVAESEPRFSADAEAVLSASQPLVEAIGPWTEARLPPPAEGRMRMTFLVSDGMYFGDGPMRALQGDPLAAPIINAATKLLLSVVDASVGTGGSQPSLQN